MKKLMVTALALVLVMGGEPLWGIQRVKNFLNRNERNKYPDLPLVRQDSKQESANTNAPENNQKNEQIGSSNQDAEIQGSAEVSKGRLQGIRDSFSHGLESVKTGFKEYVSDPIKEKYTSTKTTVKEGARSAWDATKKQASLRKNQIKAKFGDNVAQSKVLKRKGEGASDANKKLALEKINVRKGKEKVKQEALANDIAALDGLLNAENISDNRKAALESLKNRKERSLLTSQSNEALILRQKALLEGNVDEAAQYKVLSNLHKLDRRFVGQDKQEGEKDSPYEAEKNNLIFQASKDKLLAIDRTVEIDIINNKGLLDKIAEMKGKAGEEQDKIIAGNDVLKSLKEESKNAIKDEKFQTFYSDLNSKIALSSNRPSSSNATPSPALRAQIEAITAKNATVAGAKYVGSQTVAGAGYVGGKIKEGGKAVKQGIEATPGKIASGAGKVGKAVVRVGKTITRQDTIDALKTKDKETSARLQELEKQIAELKSEKSGTGKPDEQ